VESTLPVSSANSDLLLYGTYGNVNSFGISKTIAVDAGVYNVTETVPDGWSTNSILLFSSCSIATSFNPYIYSTALIFNSHKLTANSLKNVIIESGKTTICTFGNAKKGLIKIVTNAIGGNEKFNIDVTSNANTDQNITLRGSDVANVSVEPGLPTPSQKLTYSVVEHVPEGWTLSSAFCDGSYIGTNTGVGNLSLAANQITTCTFTNIKNGSTPQPGLQLFAAATGDDDTFHYTVGNPITTSGGLGTSGVTNLAIGTSTIEQMLPDGWKEISAACDHPFTFKDGELEDVSIVAGQLTV